MSSARNPSGTVAARQAKGLATASLAGSAYFLIVVFALHILRPDYDPVRRFVSEYAVGPYGMLMTSAFFGLSLGFLALTVGLYRGLSPAGRSWAGLLLLGLAGVCVLLAGIFPTDLQGDPVTPTGANHDSASLLMFVSLTVAMILLSQRFNRDENWRLFHRLAFNLSLVVLVGFIGFMYYAITQSEWIGLVQRAYILAFVTWLLLTAARLRLVAGEG